MTHPMLFQVASSLFDCPQKSQRWHDSMPIGRLKVHKKDVYSGCYLLGKSEEDCLKSTVYRGGGGGMTY